MVDRPDPEEEEQNLNLDKGYDNPRSRKAAAEEGYVPHIRRIGEEKKKCDRSKGHKPRRWVVERTFSWLGRYRRLSKDYEHLPESSEAVVKIAAIHHLLHRVRPEWRARSQRFRFKKKPQKRAA